MAASVHSRKTKTILKKNICPKKTRLLCPFIDFSGGWIDKAQKIQVLTKLITFRRRHNFGLVDKVITFFNISRLFYLQTQT